MGHFVACIVGSRALSFAFWYFGYRALKPKKRDGAEGARRRRRALNVPVCVSCEADAFIFGSVSLLLNGCGRLVGCRCLRVGSCVSGGGGPNIAGYMVFASHLLQLLLSCDFMFHYLRSSWRKVREPARLWKRMDEGRPPVSLGKTARLGAVCAVVACCARFGSALCELAFWIERQPRNGHGSGRQVSRSCGPDFVHGPEVKLVLPKGGTYDV